MTLPLLMATGLPIDVANGSNRIAVVLQGLVATHDYRKKGQFQPRLYKKLLPLLLLGALGGAFLATQISAHHVRKIFGLLFLVMSLFLLLRKKMTGSKRKLHPLRYPAIFLVGLYGGFIQAGVGLWILLTSSSLFGEDPLESNAVKLPLTLTFTIPALLLFAWSGLVEIIPGLILAAGTVVGALIGVRLSLKGGAPLILKAVTLVLLVTGLELLFGN